MKGVVKIKNMRVYAFHGCLKEESKIGGDYLVNLRAHCDLSSATRTDRDSCLKEVSVVTRVVVEISKINPPINADVESVAVLLEGRRG